MLPQIVTILVARPLSLFPISSTKRLVLLEIQSHTFPAISLILSQFLYSKTPIAIAAPIAITTKPNGLVKNATAALRAFVAAVAIMQIAFHAVVAAVIAT